MFPRGSTGYSVLDIYPHVVLVKQIDIISLFDGSFVEVTDRFTGVCSGRSIDVVGVDSILDVFGSMLGPGIKNLLVGLGVGDRGTELRSLGCGRSSTS